MTMYCPKCGQNYTGRTVCPACHVELRQAPSCTWGRHRPGKLLEKWPRDAQGEPVRPAFLKHCSGLDMEDSIALSLLEAYGIPAIAQYPNDGEFGKVILGMGGSGTDLFVPETMLEDAKNLFEEAPEDDV